MRGVSYLWYLYECPCVEVCLMCAACPICGTCTSALMWRSASCARRVLFVVLVRVPLCAGLPHVRGVSYLWYWYECPCVQVCLMCAVCPICGTCTSALVCRSASCARRVLFVVLVRVPLCAGLPHVCGVSYLWYLYECPCVQVCLMCAVCPICGTCTSALVCRSANPLTHRSCSKSSKLL